MNFPHQMQQKGRAEIRSILAHAITRQASSPTARAMILAESFDQPLGDPIDLRIRYFAAHLHGERSPSGAFFNRPVAATTEQRRYESVVYQSGSTNLKTRDANHPTPAAVDLPHALEA